MKRSVLFLSFVFIVITLLFSLTNAYAFTFEKTPIYDVVASELSIPATYNLTIKGAIPNEYFQTYSLVNVKILPWVTFQIPTSEDYDLVLSALPIDRADQKGKFTYQYYIKGAESGAKTDFIEVKVLPLKNLIIPKIQEISREDKTINLEITVPEKINFGNATVYINSQIYSGSEKIELPIYSTNTYTLSVGEKLQKVVAGKYPITLTFELNNEYNYTVEVEATITEVSSLTSSQSVKRSFFGFTYIYTKTNEGNTVKLATVEINKNRFERGFTSYNYAPTSEEDTSFFIKQIWQKELMPGESLVVEARVDYTIPILILVLLIICAIGLIIVRRPRVIVRKKAIKMQTKGGEFAVKVILFVKNISQEVKEVNLIDGIPGMTTLYEKFGAAKPDKIENNRLTWHFGTILPGEEIIVSYVIYSKIRPVGTVVLPESIVHYVNERNKRKYTKSNRVLVVTND